MTAGRTMLFRFSLYGFLKNQQYYEPFIILALLEKGLSFFSIGLLIGFRELCVVFLEIPSGAIADLYGRRRSMILSFFSYIASFVIFAFGARLGVLFVAMFFFAIGEVFRTGTHKAMIFDWLQRQGRLDQRTKVYGFTRSWAKIGSALSALLAACFVFWSGKYSTVFLFCVFPYAINIVNLIGYPKYLDGEAKKNVSISAAARILAEAIRLSFVRKRLRHLFYESMLWEGVYKVTKDYLQPVLKRFALILPALVALPVFFAQLDETKRSAVVIGVVFAVNFLVMGIFSRNAHRIKDWFGTEDNLVMMLWRANLMIYGLMTVCLVVGRPLLAAICFIGAGALQNVFRPAQISRFDACSSLDMRATILSVESQAKSGAAAIISPIVGYAVDRLSVLETAADSLFWPASLMGVLACLIAFLIPGTRVKRVGDG
jgi:MFS family permease